MLNLKKKIKTVFYRLRKGRFLRNPVPVNLQIENKPQQRISEEVDYAIRVGQSYLGYAAAYGGVKGKRILEIGPGINVGSALVLKCCGAGTVAVSDRYPALWQDSYHIAFYTELKRQLEIRQPTCDTSCLAELIASRSYPTEIIDVLPVPLEDMAGVKDGCFDAVFSNAVLEHLFDHESAFLELCRVSADGAYGFHQVDFRDHRDFSRPLEYLMHSEADFKKMFDRCFGECGNRLRPFEMEGLWQANGFDIVQMNPMHFAEDEYLENVARRLGRRRRSRYAGVDKEKLRAVSAHFIVRKKAKE